MAVHEPPRFVEVQFSLADNTRAGYRLLLQFECIYVKLKTLITINQVEASELIPGWFDPGYGPEVTVSGLFFPASTGKIRPLIEAAEIRSQH